MTDKDIQLWAWGIFGKDQKTMERSDAVALAGTLAEIIDRADLNDVREILAALVSRIELDGDDVSIFWNF